MIQIPLVALFVAVLAVNDATPPPNTADDVIARMIARDAERQAALRGYTGVRRYVLENQSRHKRAEMLVRVTCRPNGLKDFEIMSEEGWGAVRKHIFPRLIEAEAESSRPGAHDQSRITPQNYTFEMKGIEQVREHPAYVIAIEPKTPNKYLVRGKIWVDAHDFAIVRVDGKPAKNPSFWIKSVHFVHDYDKSGSFWFPVSDRSVTDVRIVGATEMTIEYFDYAPNAAPNSQ